MSTTPPRGTEEDPDRELVIRWKRAHSEREAASQEIHRLYSEKMDGFFRRKGFRPEEVEELTQTTFSRVFNGLGDPQGAIRRFAAWLFQIAENVYLDDLRRRNAGVRAGRKAEISLDEMLAVGEEPAVPAGFPETGEEALIEERKTALRREIDDLPPRTRRCLQLHIYHRLKIKEVGLVMNISPETVKALLYQARKRLKERLAEYLSDPGF